MRWTAALLLRPVTFVLAIVAAAITGHESGSFWYGLLAFLVAFGTGRVLGALVRGRRDRTVRTAIWPAAATGYAFLFATLGLPPVATFFAAAIAASLTKQAVPGPRRWVVRRVDLTELLP